MTGDELPYPSAARSLIRSIIGDDVPNDVALAQVCDELERTLEPFFLVPDQSRRDRVERKWRDLMGDRVICMDGPEDTCHVAAGLVGLVEGVVPNLDALAER